MRVRFTILWIRSVSSHQVTQILPFIKLFSYNPSCDRYDHSHVCHQFPIFSGVNDIGTLQLFVGSAIKPGIMILPTQTMHY